MRYESDASSTYGVLLSMEFTQFLHSYGVSSTTDWQWPFLFYLPLIISVASRFRLLNRSVSF